MGAGKTSRHEQQLPAGSMQHQFAAAAGLTGHLEEPAVALPAGARLPGRKPAQMSRDECLSEFWACCLTCQGRAALERPACLPASLPASQPASHSF